MTLEEKLSKIRKHAEEALARAEAATEGPWKFDGVVVAPNAPSEAGDPTVSLLGGVLIVHPEVHEDGIHIATARMDVPLLARRVLALEKVVQALRQRLDAYEFEESKDVGLLALLDEAKGES